ncbi:DUF3718 domain-containing protein [Shewanella eurypsychrophilus]|uniref:DUF3718 domain-containing protein n=1 Tax=Shewanella eurypsychrophilus TaxID=2593656 RepID=A0ABX6V2J1_9GAMM|nr:MULTISPECIES: DUF3718 domain-containing protein [Shewanella]QFU21535.1 DUF3718 domain-containing protein [Shewanella sp. YLB-09]QPG56825.1 DUF3718 domain-containing protein [Shewanella eurypsychrophilus]
MRLLPTAIAAIIAASAFSVPVQANSDQLAANICNYVQTNDKNRLRKKLKENRVKLRNIYSGVSCSGDSLLRTAMKSGSDKVGTFIAKRLSVSDLSAAEADGNTIVAWAEGNGHSDNAITAAIKDRVAGG